jgi:excisionase family DNA binding protein
MRSAAVGATETQKPLREDKNVYRTEAARLKLLFENQKGFLTYKELSEILGVSVRTLRRYVNLAQLPCKHVGRNVRFIPSELARHFAKQGEAS